MLQSTVGQILINEALPPSMRDYNRVYDKEGLNSVLTTLAHEYPEQYREVSKKLADIGGEVAFRQGGLTFSPDHLIRPQAAEALAKNIRQQVIGIYQNDKKSDDQKKKEVIDLLSSSRDKMVESSFGEALKAKNPLAIQASLGFRGDKNSINNQIGASLLYTDYKGDPIPFPITRSFSQGLSPMEYLAATYGARQGVISTKMCLHEDELVLMADWSSKPIRSVQVGDRVMGSDRFGRLKPTKVTRVFNNGVRTCYRYLFRVGRSRTRFLSLTCTEDHKVLATVKKATGDVKEIEVREPTPLTMKEARLRDNPVRNSFSAWVSRGGDSGGIEVPEALLAGLMIGDGCMAPSTHGSYHFSCADKSLIEETAEYLAGLGIAFVKSGTVGYDYSLNSLTRQPFKRDSMGRVLPGHANSAKAWLRANLGDKKAHEKTLPANVDSWDNKSVANLLGGIFATDGSISTAMKGKHVAVTLWLTSESVVQSVKRLLEYRFGIWCSSVSEVPPDNRVNAVNSLYGFSLVGYEAVKRFSQFIPLVGVKKKRLTKALTGLSPGAHHEYVTCKVQGRELLGQLPTFDIEVDNEDHLFALANGLIVSNSTAEAGALNKQITQAAHQVMVSHDSDDSDWHKGSQLRGLPVDTADTANVGALLSHDIGGYKRNTVLSPKVLKDLQQQGIGRILVRSPMVGGMPDGGIHARDAGFRNANRLPPANTFLGIESGQSIGEPLSQLQLCLAAGTMVRMADWSVKAIEEIAVNDWVMGSDVNGNVFPVRVANTYNNGVRECVSTLFGVGGTKERIELVSTPEHKLLGVSRRWGPKRSRYTRGIQPVNTSCLSFAGQMPSAVSNDTGKSEPFALLLGLLLGDGCYTVAVDSVNFSCYDTSLIEDTKDYLAALGLKASKRKGHKGYYKIAQIEDSPRLRSKNTGRLLPMGGAVNPIKKELIRRKMIGKYAHEKCFPDDIWSWNQQSVAALIGGYFATDGSVYGITSNGESYDNLGVSFTSTSITMLETLRQLLAVRFGIFATVPNKQTKNRKRPAWSMSINRTDEVVRFHKEIPLYGIKRLTFERLVANWKPTVAKNWSMFFRKSQTPVGPLPTYDIEVDHPDHLFQLANGLIVSNSAKHQGGVAGGSKIGGFKLIEALANPPKHMPYGATHAQADGTVDNITTNPAGGHDVFIGGQKHYVSGAMNLRVKKGDTVEAGDVLSDGTPNPREIIRHKGIGEGRRYLMQSLHDAYKENRISSRVLRRNLEPVVRGMVDHVRMTDFWNHNGPDDVVKYSHIENNWQPRPGFVTKLPRQAVGKYLEEPVLHHTIGTQIRPSMLKEFEQFKVGPVMVHHEPPPFEPHMLRATENLQHDPDWQVRLGGQYLQRGLLDAAHRGLSSSPGGTSFIPGLIRGDSLNKPLGKPLNS